MVLGMSGAALDSAVRRGCPRQDDGTFSVPAVVGWLLRERRATSEAPSPSLESWRRHRSDLSELRLHRERGLLVDRAEVVRDLGTACLTVRNRLLSGVKKSASIIGPLVPGQGGIEFVEQILQDEAMATLAAFSKGLDRIHDEVADATRDAATATALPANTKPDVPSMVPGVVTNPPVATIGNTMTEETR